MMDGETVDWCVNLFFYIITRTRIILLKLLYVHGNIITREQMDKLHYTHMVVQIIIEAD